MQSSSARAQSRIRRLVFLAGAVSTLALAGQAHAAPFFGALYAGTNILSGNSVAAYGRNADGTLSPIAAFATGGLGASLDTGNGSDPFLAAGSITTADGRFLLVVNAGSNTLSSFRINPDFGLTLIGSAPSGGVGPVSIAYRNGLVYVANVDADGVFTDATDQMGSLSGLRLNTTTGVLTPIAGSTRTLGARPADLAFAADGANLVVSAVNAGSANLASGSNAELSSFDVAGDGTLSAGPLSEVASTPPNSPDGRNLATAIGFEIVERDGRTFVVSTEAREFLPIGLPGTVAQFQTGSVSTWELLADGTLSARSQDVLTGMSFESGPDSACWLVFSPDRTRFWVASESSATISSFTLNADGTLTLVGSIEAAGVPFNPAAADPAAGADGFVDIAISGDDFLYQLLSKAGEINAYSIGADGLSLSLLQVVSDLLPDENVAGLVFVEPQQVPAPAALALFGLGIVAVARTRMRRR